MLPRLIEQAVILAAAVALLGVPGTALVSLLRIRAALPDALCVPAGALLGVVVACVATFVQLALEAGVEVAIGVHVALSVALALAAYLVNRRRTHATGDRTAPAVVGIARWTWAIVLASAAMAWVVRGAVRLDTLYHVSVSRKLVELPGAGFDTVNRFADGGPNPAYALPAWHALVGWASWLSSADPIAAWEILPVLVVALGALAAGGLARVVLGVAWAEPLGALAWMLMRVAFPRREVDGDAIAYGGVPGQVVFELALPVAFAAIAVALWASSPRVRRAALVAAVAAIAITVVLHANYVVYVAIVGLGYAAWWLACGPFGRDVVRRTLVVSGIVAAACAGFMGVLLPILAQLENFGSAPEDVRIDYHLAETAGMDHIRGGHLYETFGIPGLVALLAAPVVALLWRRREAYLVSGGLLALGAFSLLPPLYALLAATGSLTIGLRINHAVGILLVPVFAGLVLLAAEAAVRLSGGRRSRMLAFAVGALLVLVATSVVVGYQRFLPDAPGYLAMFALAIAFAWRLVERFRGRVLHTDERPAAAANARLASTPLSPRAVVVAALVLTVGVGTPAGLVSMRRAVLDADPIAAPTSLGELECLSGPVADALQDVPPGSVVLSDPKASFQAMALAPVYVVGDYKVWNAATGDNRTVDRLAQLNRFFDTSLGDEQRLEVLDAHGVDYLLVDLHDPRWLRGHERTTTSLVEQLWSGLDSFADVQAYDGGRTAALVARNPDTFVDRVIDPRGRKAAIPTGEIGVRPDCHSFALWTVGR